MAISRFKTSTLAQGLPKYQDVWDGTTALFDSDYELIERVTLSTSTASISFSSIPQTYRHLQIRGIARTTGTGGYRNGISMRVNGDSGSNYSFHRLWGYGSGIAGASATSQNTLLQVAFATDDSGLANSFGVSVIDILDYANTNKNKVVRSLTGYDNNTTGGSGEQGGVVFLSNAWYSTSAVTSLSIYPDNLVNLKQYSSFALYGIKGAS